METLIKQAIELLKQESGAVLSTPEEAKYFSPRKKPAPAPKQPLEIDGEMKQLVSKVLPDLPLAANIPDDAKARKMSELYKEQHLNAKVLVLSLGETGPGLQFLQNVASAIDTLLAPAKMIEMRKIERENSWEMTLNSAALQLVVAPPFQTWKTIALARFYRENPSSKTHFLQNIPLLFMQPTAAYLKNPDLKRELWKMLSTLLSTST
jgi:hypothetical protein